MKNALEMPISVDFDNDESPIAMVDDAELDFKLAKRFHKRSGIPNPLIHFNNGAAFLVYLESVKERVAPIPVIVLMDINMPRMNGFEILAKIRSDEAFASLPVVMMTSSDDPHDRKRAADAGAIDYLIKPYNPQFYLDFFNSLKNE